MTGYLLASLLAFFAVECFFRLPFGKESESLLAVSKKSVRVLGSKRISDHWKERVLARYAREILKSSFYLALLFTGMLACLGVSGFLLEMWFDPQPTMIETLASPIGWFWMTVVASAYLYLRNRFTAVSKKSGYTLGDRVLHHLALDVPWIGRISLEIDQTLFRNKEVKQVQAPIFISGLARAGTTILMRTFYETGKFRSLIYRDMPWVLMPGIWKRLSQPFHQNKANKERAHRDGIEVNFDSPEAFEEVFWRTFSANEYLFEDHLSPYSPNEEVIHQFQQFVSQVVLSADQTLQQRYLSKNNNNILRLGSIRQAFPDALIIVPFRDPIQHAISLFQLHIRFCATHEIDSFSYNYMEWLGHHEFGATHRPFQFGGHHTVTAKDHHPGNMNYWLALWINTYHYLLETAPKDTVFVSFEELGREPRQTISRLFSMANLSINDCSIKEKIKTPKVKQEVNIDQELKKYALQIYRDLSSSSRNVSTHHQ
jgi:hypothetical protein